MTEDTLDWQDLRSERGLARAKPARILRHYWYVVFICAVLGGGCGAVYALKRPPVYTATARLSAVSVNASNAAGLSGSLQAAEELTSTFARVVQSKQVVDTVAKALNTTPAWVAEHLSGTPVPSSPFVTISANASSPAVAMKAANAALSPLNRYARGLVGGASDNASSLLASVRSDSIQVSLAQNRLQHLKAKAHAQAQAQTTDTTSIAGTTTGAATPSPALQNQINTASAQVAEAQTQLGGAQAAYTQQAENQLTFREAVTVSPALTASSDRKQVAQVAILVGLLIGLLIGAAGALALGSRSSRLT
jgi:subunit length determinant Wzz-like protein